MKYKSMNNVVIATALLVCFSAKAVVQIEAPSSQPDANQQVQANQPANQPAAQAQAYADQVMSVLRACLTNFEDKASFCEFIDRMLTILKDPVAREQIKKERPDLNVDALIVALESIRLQTNTLMIGWKLRPFFKNLPSDLQNMKLLTAGLAQRLAIKK